MTIREYRKLKDLLETQEQFPITFTHKFIGRNSPKFNGSVQALEKQFPKIRKVGSRSSSGQAHLALTYEFTAENATEIIQVIQATGQLDDVLMIL